MIVFSVENKLGFPAAEHFRILRGFMIEGRLHNLRDDGRKEEEDFMKRKKKVNEKEQRKEGESRNEWQKKSRSRTGRRGIADELFERISR